MSRLLDDDDDDDDDDGGGYRCKCRPEDVVGFVVYLVKSSFIMGSS